MSHFTPTAQAASIGSVQTSASGATYVALADQPCDAVEIVNAATGAVDIEYRRGGAGSAMIIPLGTSRWVIGITNAAQIAVRRVDQSNTQVTVAYEAFGLR